MTDQLEEKPTYQVTSEEENENEEDREEMSISSSAGMGYYLNKPARWGSMDQRDLDGFFFRKFELEEAEANDCLDEKLAELGLSDKEEWWQIESSFYRLHFIGTHAHRVSEEEAQTKYTQAAMNARHRNPRATIVGAKRSSCVAPSAARRACRPRRSSASTAARRSGAKGSENMLGRLSPEVRQQLEPLVVRWDGFADEIRSRAEEIETEADGGLDELIAADPLNPNSLSAGFNAVKARYQGLQGKLEQAVEKLEEAWDETTGDLELEGEEQCLVHRLRYGIANQSRELHNELERLNARIEAKKNASWARALKKLAEQECAKPRACPACGAQIEISIQHAHSAVRCPYCDSVNEIDIGPATGLYYKGPGVDALAHERAFDLWLSHHQAEHNYLQWRHPIDRDRQGYLGAVRAYWAAHFQEYAKLHPGFDKPIDQAVQEKLAHYDIDDNVSDQRSRAFFGKLVQLAITGDRGAVEAHLDSCSNLDLDEAVESVHERGDRQGTIMLLNIKYEREDEDEAREGWILKQLRKLDESLATR